MNIYVFSHTGKLGRWTTVKLETDL